MPSAGGASGVGALFSHPTASLHSSSQCCYCHVGADVWTPHGGFPDSSVGKESACNEETLVRFLASEDPLEKGLATHSSIKELDMIELTTVCYYFPGGLDGKASTSSVGDLGSISALGRFPGEGKGYLLQYSCLENTMDGGAW